MNNPNNKRIAINTAMLYFRMILIMGLTLFTTRIILRELGVEDFGIYNVVGGVVTMLGFLSASMSAAVQRFLSFEVGKKDDIKIGRVFSMSLNIQILLAVIVLIIAETIGLWFINTQLTIDPERITAANWVYQCSVLTVIFSFLNVPYHAAILSYEKMSVFAYLSIIEVILKLLAVLSLGWVETDSLTLYAIYLLIISFLVRGMYGIYVNYYIRTCKYKFSWDKKLFQTLLNFAGWNLWGNVAAVTYMQGLNILLNIFFGPAVNAARAIAFQVSGAINSFSSNFQIALKPQIIKSYAINEHDYMHTLMFSGARYSFFLMLILITPVLISTPFLIKLWLGIIPDYTVIFCRLVLIECLINSLSGTLMAGAQASGKIRIYQGIVGGLIISILPISYLVLLLGSPPQATFMVSIIVSVIALIARIIIISPLLSISKKTFVKEVIIPISLVTSLIAIVAYIILNIMIYTPFRLLLSNGLVSFFSLAIIYLIGLKRTERRFIRGQINMLSFRFIGK